MTEQMTVQQAAAAIRADALPEPPAEARYFQDFAADVCGELGMDRTPMNIARVMHALQDKEIGPVFKEYPKWVGNPDAGTARIVHSKEEEDDYAAQLEAADNPEEASRIAAERGASVPGLGPQVDSVREPVSNDAANRPKYEPGALPGEPGGQDGPQANPSSSGPGGIQQGGGAPAQVPPRVVDNPRGARRRAEVPPVSNDTGANPDGDDETREDEKGGDEPDGEFEEAGRPAAPPPPPNR